MNPSPTPNPAASMEPKLDSTSGTEDALQTRPSATNDDRAKLIEEDKKNAPAMMELATSKQLANHSKGQHDLLAVKNEDTPKGETKLVGTSAKKARPENPIVMAIIEKVERVLAKSESPSMINSEEGKGSKEKHEELEGDIHVLKAENDGPESELEVMEKKIKRLERVLDYLMTESHENLKQIWQ